MSDSTSVRLLWRAEERAASEAVPDASAASCCCAAAAVRGASVGSGSVGDEGFSGEPCAGDSCAGDGCAGDVRSGEGCLLAPREGEEAALPDRRPRCSCARWLRRASTVGKGPSTVGEPGSLPWEPRSALSSSSLRLERTLSERTLGGAER
jgi:hypothetical protein